MVIADFVPGAKNCQYTNCGDDLKFQNLKRNGNYFVYIPLKEQLRNLLSSDLFHKLKREDSSISDITSSKYDKKLKEERIISCQDVTIQWNADGVQTFKSSKVSMCPIQVMVNELVYKTRIENVLLVGVWATAHRPGLDIYLKPFVAELKDLRENGVEVCPPGFAEPIIIQVHTILTSVDSVERCALQCVHQYNREFGCSYCFHPGVRVPVGDGKSRVYPVDNHTKRNQNLSML